MKTFFAAMALLMLAVCSPAQTTVTPPISEVAGKVGHGSFTVMNTALAPIFVTLEARSFSVDKQGNPTYRPLDQTVHLSLDGMSVRLGPKQQRTFFYTVKCDTKPCAFTVYNTFTAGHTDEGMQVAIHLPATVYFCDKMKDCRQDTLMAMGYDTRKK